MVSYDFFTIVRHTQEIFQNEKNLVPQSFSNVIRVLWVKIFIVNGVSRTLCLVDKYIVIIVNINFVIFGFVANNTLLLFWFFFFQPLKSSYSLVTKGRSRLWGLWSLYSLGILFGKRTQKYKYEEVSLACRLIHLWQALSTCGVRHPLLEKCAGPVIWNLMVRRDSLAFHTSHSKCDCKINHQSNFKTLLHDGKLKKKTKTKGAHPAQL